MFTKRWLLGSVQLRPLIVLAACLLPSCAAIDNSLSPRVGDLNVGIDQAFSDAILTNIVRASVSQPLTFIAISKVSGSQSVKLANGLPTWTFGGGLSTQDKKIIFGNNSLNNEAGGNFDVAPLAGRDFTKGLLGQLSLLEIELLLRQGVPRGLLYNLIFDGIEFYYQENNRHESFRNDPSDERNYASFRGTVSKLIAHGFSVESRMEENPYHDKDDKSGAQPKYVPRSRFCFDQALNVAGFAFGEEWLCKTKWYFESAAEQAANTANRRPPNADAFVRFRTPIDVTVSPGKVVKLYGIEIRVRSIYGIFNFLGRILAEKNMDKVVVAENSERVSVRGSPLLVIERGVSGCFSAIDFNGERYCVPQEGSRNTKRVFAILSQLIALKTQPGDLPFTPTVRIAP